MEILHDVMLNHYTTFQMGGRCKKLYIPETERELIDLVKEIDNCKFIGGGSNLLISDRTIFDNVILLRKYSNYINLLEEDIVDVSAAVTLLQLIHFINKHELGGIEYLSSVPGLVGGAIYMNAGRGKASDCSIADYIISVRVLCLEDDEMGNKRGEIIEMNKEECGFTYRSSIFKKNQYLILSSKFKFDSITQNESEKRINERKEWCKKTQDRSAPNFGSVFSYQNKKIMKIIMKIRFGNKDSVHFSGKAINWMLNPAGKNAKVGTFDEAVQLINKVKKIHKFFGKKCETEVIIWQ